MCTLWICSVQAGLLFTFAVVLCNGHRAQREGRESRGHGFCGQLLCGSGHGWHDFER